MTMQTPVEIDFQGMSGTAEIRQAITTYLAQIEKRFGRITAGRLMVKGPGGHHRTGEPYEVNLRLALPEGREVNVGRTPEADERQSQWRFALHDAFKRARRQLQDHVRQLQGQVKQHESQPIGTVTKFDPSGEFGFLEAADGREIYFHRNSVLDGGFPRLTAGTRVVFAEEEGQKGPQASTVKLLGRHGMRVAGAPPTQAEWQHFPHDADIGVRGWGATPAEAFEQAAVALSAAVTDAEIRPTTPVAVACDATDIELLLVEWLNAMIYEMATGGMLFGTFATHIDGTHLEGTMWGEPVDVERHAPASEPKGATYTALRVAREPDGRWSAGCVIDV
jgi:SHS2 domain-containing protein/cold shock CspA family protein